MRVGNLFSTAFPSRNMGRVFFAPSDIIPRTDGKSAFWEYVRKEEKKLYQDFARELGKLGMKKKPKGKRC